MELEFKIQDEFSDDMQLTKLNFSADSKSQFPDPNPSISSSFNSLLSQNEDLAARLRVTLKRLSHIENQNKFLTEAMEGSKNQSVLFKDQLLIWQEKEKIWQEKEKQIEAKFYEKQKTAEFEISILRQKIETLATVEENLERHKKYHEKIKTSVKPYIQKLKSYAQSLYQQTQSLNACLMEKEAQLDQSNRTLEESKEKLQKITQDFEFQKNQLVLMFEDQRADLKKELSTLHEQNESLVEKTRILDRSLERQDELENLIVALRRAKDESFASHHNELAKVKAALQKEAQEKTVLLIQCSDLQEEHNKLKITFDNIEKTFKDHTEQMASLRYLWSQKSQECEKLNLRLQSLEKLNLELSQKLKELREQES